MSTSPTSARSPHASGARQGGRRPPPPVGGLAARRAALALIDAALARRGGMEDVDEADLAGLEGRDRGFARALALGTLRWLGPVDRALSARLRKPPPPAVTSLLRLGAAQMLALDTPPHAAVSTTLALAAGIPDARPFVKLMNAVLRGLDRERPVVTPDQFAPDWLLARWRAAYGEETALAIAARIAEEPPTDLSLRDPLDEAAIAEAVEGAVLPGPTVRTGRRGDVSAWPGFAGGRWWVQDAAAALPARLLGVTPDQTALDLCAAPGGKTLQLAAAGWDVVGVELAPTRLARLRENLIRTALPATLVEADVMQWRPAAPVDAVLLDAPCSATGIYRRHPDVLHRVRPAAIAELATAQAAMLARAAEWVKPGGTLVYAVCSLELQEGERVAAGAVGAGGLTVDPIRADELPAGLAPTAEGWLRIPPGALADVGGCDGFFIARFVKT